MNNEQLNPNEMVVLHKTVPRVVPAKLNEQEKEWCRLYVFTYPGDPHKCTRVVYNTRGIYTDIQAKALLNDDNVLLEIERIQSKREYSKHEALFDASELKEKSETQKKLNVTAAMIELKARMSGHLDTNINVNVNISTPDETRQRVESWLNNIPLGVGDETKLPDLKAQVQQAIVLDDVTLQQNKSTTPD